MFRKAILPYTGRFLMVATAIASLNLELSAPALAYTECNETVTKIWAGDGGMIWIYYNDGGAAIITGSDPNREAAISLATTALVTGRQIVVRYNASGVSCTTAGVNDFAGLFLLK